MFNKTDLTEDERNELKEHVNSTQHILEGMYGSLATYQEIVDTEMLNKYVNAVLFVHTSVLRDIVDLSPFLNLVGEKREEIVLKLGSVLCGLYGQGFADGRKLMVN